MLCVLEEGKQCEAEDTHLYQVALMGSAALLFVIIAGIFLWIILKVNTGCFLWACVGVLLNIAEAHIR